MRSFCRALVVLALLCGSAAFGFLVKCQLLQPYMQTAALGFVNAVIALLVTIAAIVMGLLINAAKSFIETTEDRWVRYATLLIRLDQSMRNYGPEAEPIRHRLRSFTAAGIVNFWPAEAISSDVRYPDIRKMPKTEAHQVLTGVLNRIKLEIIQMKRPDPLRERLAADCFDQYKEFATARWTLIMEPERLLPTTFFRMLVSWLMMIFMCFGLRASANPLELIVIALAAITLSSMTFAITDMVDPYSGRYNISSKNMRHALELMLCDDVTDLS
jgi:hypothetical protein